MTLEAGGGMPNDNEKQVNKDTCSDENSKWTRYISEEDQLSIVSLLKQHYRIETPTEENITPQIVKHVWDKLGLHLENEADEAEKEESMRHLAKEILELRY